MTDSELDATRHFHEAVECHRRGRLAEAEVLYRRVLDVAPLCTPALDMLGVLCLQQDRCREAVDFLEQTLAILPNRAAQLSNLGVGYRKLGRIDEALAAFESAIAADGRYARAYSNRGDILNARGDYAAALADCERALGLDASLIEAHCNRANALYDLRRYQEAYDGYSAGIARAPQTAVLYGNRGNTLEGLDRNEEALADFAVALALEPAAETYANRSNAFKALGRFDEARADCETALRLDQDCALAHWNLALLDLQAGRFADGWRGYEARWQTKPLMFERRRFDQPAWDGSPMTGTLLVYAEQGLGDSLQFCRFLAAARARVGRLIVEVQSPLLPLLRRLDLDASLVAAGDDLPVFDCHAAMMSLPLLLGIAEPSPQPYLSADPTRRSAWRNRLGEKRRPRVGLCWSGNPAHANDTRRSLNLAQLAPLMNLPFEFHVVQKDIRAEERATLTDMSVVDHGAELSDFADTAALVAEMDLTLSVDTSVAHLAGAIGAPIWLLLPYAADWRWLRDRVDSPWYAGMRLFRQPKAGDWDGVLTAVGRALAEFAAPGLAG